MDVASRRVGLLICGEVYNPALAVSLGDERPDFAVDIGHGSMGRASHRRFERPQRCGLPCVPCAAHPLAESRGLHADWYVAKGVGRDRLRLGLVQGRRRSRRALGRGQALGTGRCACFRGWGQLRPRSRLSRHVAVLQWPCARSAVAVIQQLMLVRLSPRPLRSASWRP